MKKRSKLVLGFFLITPMYVDATTAQYEAARRAANNWCKKNYTKFPVKYSSIEQCTQDWIDSGYAEFLLPEWY